MLEYIILGFLVCNALTGYEIKKYFDSGIGLFYKASFGSVYPILAKLTEKGYVVCENQDQGNRVKKKYSITLDGKEAFFAWLEADTDIESIEAFMAKVYFFDKLPFDAAHSSIEVYEQKLKNYLNALVLKRKEFEALSSQEDYYFKLSTLYFGICKLQSIIEWCETVKSRKDLELLIHNKQ